MAWQDLKFSLDVGGADLGDAQISVQLGARSRFRGAPAAVVAAVDAAWDPRRALAVEGDGPHGLRAWATPEDKEAVAKELLAVCEGLGLAQTAPSQADADAEARRRAKEAKRERNRRIREEKERRARKKAAKEAKRAAAAAAAS